MRVVVVVMIVAIQRECTASPCPKQSAVFRCRGDDSGCALATDMPVEANDTVRPAHHDMQLVADHEHCTASFFANPFNLLIEGRRPTLICLTSALMGPNSVI